MKANHESKLPYLLFVRTPCYAIHTKIFLQSSAWCWYQSFFQQLGGARQPFAEWGQVQQEPHFCWTRQRSALVDRWTDRLWISGFLVAPSGSWESHKKCLFYNDPQPLPLNDQVSWFSVIKNSYTCSTGHWMTSNQTMFTV